MPPKKSTFTEQALITLKPAFVAEIKEKIIFEEVPEKDHEATIALFIQAVQRLATDKGIVAIRNNFN
jgi:hypothetical protein